MLLADTDVMAVLKPADIEHAFDLDDAASTRRHDFRTSLPGGSRLMKARVFVTLKPSVFDPQGHTITEALHQMGYGGVDDVRQGKYFELKLPGTSADQAQDAGRRGRAEAAGQPGHRELPHRGRRMKFAIVVFPGSNCDHDAYHATKHVLGQDAEFVWHKETDLKGADVVILPGGFAHGDYLRTGAIARFSPVMDAVRAFAAAGNPVIGICNGFQVLLEAELLPGAMLRNTDKYKCEYVYARVEQTDTPFTNLCAQGAGAEDPHRARRGQLLRGSGDGRGA